MLSGGITKRKGGDPTGTRRETPRQHSWIGTSGPEGGEWILASRFQILYSSSDMEFRRVVAHFV